MHVIYTCRNTLRTLSIYTFNPTVPGAEDIRPKQFPPGIYYIMKIANRTFVISGGASGLGLATARDLHAHGAYVSLLDLNSDAGSSIVSELGSRAKFL